MKKADVKIITGLGGTGEVPGEGVEKQKEQRGSLGK